MELLDTGGERERRTLRALRHHRLDRVGDCDDARLEQDVLAAQAARIAGTVHTLVVLPHDLGHGPGELDASQRFEAALGVRLHQLELGRRELARPPEDLARDLQHADVDQLSHHPQAAHRVARQAQGGADAAGELRDPSCAAGLAAVLRLGQRCERLDGAEHHAFHVVHGAHDLGIGAAAAQDLPEASLTTSAWRWSSSS